MTADVHFKAAGPDGRFTATRGQQYQWWAIRTSRPDDFWHLQGRWDLQPAHSGAQVLSALSDLVAEHEALRTRYTWDGAHLKEQVVASEGSFAVSIEEVADPADVDRASTELLRALSSTDIDLAAEWPWRVGLIGVAGAIASVVVVLSHVSVDGYSLDILRRRFYQLIDDQDDGGREPALQPSAQAAREQSPAGLRRLKQSRKHWMQTLDRAGPPLLPRRRASDEKSPLVEAFLGSRSLAVADRQLSLAIGALSSSSVLISATALELAAYSDAPSVIFHVDVSNRRSHEYDDYVGTLVQPTVLCIDCAETDLVALAKKVDLRLLSAYLGACLDYEMFSDTIRMANSTRETALDLSTIFNDTRRMPSDTGRGYAVPEIAALSPYRVSTEDDVIWGPPRRRDDLVGFCLRASGTSNETILRLVADTARIPREDVAGLLLGIERRVLNAASALSTGSP